MTLGVVGGMGVHATARFYEKLIALQTVGKEQDYTDALIYSKSSIPDRSAYILKRSDESPLPALIHAIQVLRTAGCGCIAIPCVTSHYFWDKLDHDTAAPLLHMPNITAQKIAEAGFKTVGLLATSGTVQGRFFHDALAQQGIELILPTDAAQVNLMDYIYAIKAGKPTNPQFLYKRSTALQERGAQAIILGCTELCVEQINHGIPHIDTLDLLAQAALDYCKKG